MPHFLENLIFHRFAQRAVRYIAIPDLKSQDPLTKSVLEQALREFQLVPPLTIHISDPELLAGVWSVLRETYIVNQKDRALRERVASIVSSLNKCPYCQNVHSAFHENTDQNDEYNSAKKAVEQWANLTLLPKQALTLVKKIPIEKRPQLLGTAVVFHYINRIVNVFLDESPVRLPSGISGKNSQKVSKKMLGKFGKRLLKLDPKPGEFVWEISEKIPSYSLFIWAKDDPAVSKGFAQFGYAIERAGKSELSSFVRFLITSHLSDWHGEVPPLSSHWIDEVLREVSEKERAAAEFALLTARASWQIDPKRIEKLRSQGANDQRLVRIAAWGAFSAAKRIGSLLV